MSLSTQDLIDLNRKFNWDFQQGFIRETPHWQEKARKVGSVTFENVYAFHPDIPRMRKWVGDRVVRELTARSTPVRNEPWELTLGVDRREIEFDLVGQYTGQMEAMGQAGAAWPDQLVTDAQQTNPICFDGQNFYDTDHPVSLENSALGVFANDYTATDLTKDNVWALAIAMMGFKTDTGRSLELLPTLLEVPSALSRKAADAIQQINYVQAVRNVAGDQIVAAVPAENQKIFDLRLLINPKLDNDPTHWYLHSTNRMMPFVIQVAKDPTAPLAFMDLKDPNVFWQRKFIWGIEADGAAAPTLPFLSIRASTT